VNFITLISTQTAQQFFLVFFLASFSATVHSSLRQATAPLINASAHSDHGVDEALKASKALQPAEQLVVQNRLRLRKAALLMVDEQFNQARKTLSTIETASPSGAQAGLLMAESYRLESNNEQARNWFLRTARHFPYRAQTLAGLISAASDQQTMNPGLALALYSEVETQTQFAQGQLEALMASGHIEPMAVIFPSAINDDVRRTLLKHCLRHPDLNLLHASSDLQKAVKTLLQLQARNRQLTEQLSALTQKLDAYHKQRSDIETTLSNNDAQLSSLKGQLIPNNFDPGQTRIRKRLTQLNNQQTRLQAQIAFIDQASQSLPAIIDKIHRQARQLHHTAMAQLKESHMEVETVLNNSYQAYLSEMRNLTAEARLQRAEIHLSASP
jgi:predicted  nucleic acid-binding Zn-ribbon protein